MIDEDPSLNFKPYLVPKVQEQKEKSFYQNLDEEFKDFVFKLKDLDKDTQNKLYHYHMTQLTNQFIIGQYDEYCQYMIFK